ncbi:hypothetical protein MUN77_01640 [Leucobacter allii]|uniref:hypothetical protein n=1 Tax=Leucobacter allii TaxID=2932247 RepID=UPI001FD47064|nr:hypothetical protein [Leucobacter allii]UOR02062.1 hypothetical protein MUN77_01640 [Leucobacter allii]
MTSLRLLDVDQMFDQLMTDACPTGVTPIRDTQPDSYDEVPAVLWNATNNGQYDHGLWRVALTLNVLADPLTVFPICSDLYSAVTTWNVPGEGVMPGVGGVLEVTDSNVFTKINGAVVLHGKHLVQYVASFSISAQEM